MLERPTVHPYGIMTIINHAWELSFACVTPNKKSIAERGWFPYNHNLMTYPIIRATITKDEEDKERLENSYVILLLQIKVHITNLKDTSTTFDPKFLVKPISDSEKDLNFSIVTAAWCLDTIVQ